MTILDIYEYAGWFGSAPKPMAIRHGEIERILIKEPAMYMKTDLGCDGVFLGLRAEESVGRTANVKRRGMIYRSIETGMLHCIPLAYWSARDVWAYIVSRDLPYNAVYDKPWPGGREAIRVGTWAGSDPETVRLGRWNFVRQHYPQLWQEMRRRFPAIDLWG